MIPAPARVDLEQLVAELRAAGFIVTALAVGDGTLLVIDGAGRHADPTPDMLPIIRGHVPAARLTRAVVREELRTATTIAQLRAAILRVLDT